VGTDYKLDVDTGVRTKLELPTGVFAIAVEHRLQNPQALIGVAADFKLKEQKSEKFGVSLTFGDF